VLGVQPRSSLGGAFQLPLAEILTNPHNQLMPTGTKRGRHMSEAGVTVLVE
jgi:hypothetical protein